jgi:hypothetical protein
MVDDGRSRYDDTLEGDGCLPELVDLRGGGRDKGQIRSAENVCTGGWMHATSPSLEAIGPSMDGLEGLTMSSEPRR